MREDTLTLLVLLDEQLRQDLLILLLAGDVLVAEDDHCVVEVNNLG